MQLGFYFELISCEERLFIVHTCLCCLYLEVFHKIPGQNANSVHLLGVFRELVSDESSENGTLDPQFKMVPNMKENS